METNITISDVNEDAILFGGELTDDEMAPFDYIPDDSFATHPFIVVGDKIYDFDAFFRIPEINKNEHPCLNEWDSCLFLGIDRGILVNFLNDGEFAKVAQFTLKVKKEAA